MSCLVWTIYIYFFMYLFIFWLGLMALRINSTYIKLDKYDMIL